MSIARALLFGLMYNVFRAVVGRCIMYSWHRLTHSDSDSEHGLQYVGRSALAGVDEDSIDSNAEESDSANGNDGISHLAGGISDENNDVGQTAEQSIDFL